MIITCPLDDFIATIEVDDCPFNFGQTQRIAIQRQNDDNGVRNSMTFANAKVKATWDALAVAEDSTRIQYTPIIGAPVFAPGDIVEDGTGNEVPDGIGIVVGENPTTFTSNLIMQPSWVVKTLKDYIGNSLQVYLFNEAGQIGCEADDAQTPVNVYGLRIRSWSVKSRNIQGFQKADVNELGFKLPARWDDNLIAITPTDFDPVHDLLNEPA